MKNLLTTLITILVQLQSSYFLHKIHSNALPLGDVILGGMEICKQKKNLWSKFHYNGNNTKLLMKFHTINHSHYHGFVPLTKGTVVLFPNVLPISGIHLIHGFDSWVTAIQHPSGINHKQGRVNAKVGHFHRVALHLRWFT